MTNSVAAIQPPPWRFGERALFIRQGISWDEWVSVWQTAEGMHQSSSFYIGDALLAGMREFGEKFAQVVDPKYVNQQRGAMWVCSRIEPERRRANLSYSLHRELAALEPDEQDRWLALAEAGSWTVKRLKEAMVIAGLRRGNGGPPLDDSTGNESDTFGSPLEIDGKPVLVALDGGMRDTPPSPSAPITQADVSGCLDVVRDPTMVEAIGRRRCDIIEIALGLMLDAG